MRLTSHRNQLAREAGQELTRLQKELELLKQKELSGHQEKLNAYHLVVDVLAETYSDFQTRLT